MKTAFPFILYCKMKLPCLTFVRQGNFCIHRVISARFCITAATVSMAPAAFSLIISVFLCCGRRVFIITAAAVPIVLPMTIPQAMYLARQIICVLFFCILFRPFSSNITVNNLTIVLFVEKQIVFMANRSTQPLFLRFWRKISYAITLAALAAEREARNSLP